MSAFPPGLLYKPADGDAHDELGIQDPGQGFRGGQAFWRHFFSLPRPDDLPACGIDMDMLSFYVKAGFPVT